MKQRKRKNAVKGTQNEGKEVKIIEHDYKYINENCLEQLYLHDCLCNHLYFQDDRLIFEMDWMEVLASHPLNPYPQAHQSGPGRIELIHPRIIECTLAESSIAQNNPQSRNSLYYGIFIQMAYEKSIVMWNELNDISWFEDYI